MIIAQEKTKRTTFMTDMGLVKSKPQETRREENSRDKIMMSSKITLEEEEVVENKKEIVEKKVIIINKILKIFLKYF
jgi:hypothetical protein